MKKKLLKIILFIAGILIGTALGVIIMTSDIATIVAAIALFSGLTFGVYNVVAAYMKEADSDG